MTSCTVASWGHPTTYLCHVTCGGRREGGRSEVRGRYHRHLGWSLHYASIFGRHQFPVLRTVRGGRHQLPLVQHLSILRRAIGTFAARGLPQEAEDISAARACVDTFREAFNAGGTVLHDHIIEHSAVADRPGVPR